MVGVVSKCTSTNFPHNCVHLKRSKEDELLSIHIILGGTLCCDGWCIGTGVFSTMCNTTCKWWFLHVILMLKHEGSIVL